MCAALLDWALLVPNSVMPKGVEHDLNETSCGDEPPSAHFSDAERR